LQTTKTIYERNKEKQPEEQASSKMLIYHVVGWTCREVKAVAERKSPLTLLREALPSEMK
jgi:hypothetical protein